MLHPKSDADWEVLRDAYAGPGSPFENVLAVARELGCKTIVVEHRYIDLDYRGEHASFWSMRFSVPPPFTRRLHFFKEIFDEGELHCLPADPEYIGYSVLKPMKMGRVGRTVLAPPPRLREATLTTITETVSLFGNDLSVQGVPFCEQDGEYLRCAHAAAWTCHYVAVRRELVGRTSTANLVDVIPTVLSEERALPSKGMSLNQLQAVFGSLGQPALFYGFSALPDVSGVQKPEPKCDPGGNPLAPGYWDTRCISIICRYLNSGFPVLIGGSAHAWVLVGWRRDEAGKVTFIACDDQVGPYEEISSPFEHYRAPWHSIMVPLPPKVFLTGEAAENEAYKVLRSIWNANTDTKPLAEGLRSRQIQLRTRLADIRTFKRDIAKQTSSDEVLRAIRLTPLPHFVWIVEAHLRSACYKGNCVAAAVLYDATSSDHDPRMCAISVPGAVALYGPSNVSAKVIPASGELWSSMLPEH